MLKSGKTNQTVLASGTITFTLGLIISALGAESLAVYNACFANPNCISGISGLDFEGFFGILAAGLILVVVGVLQVLAGFRQLHGSTMRTSA